MGATAIQKICQAKKKPIVRLEHKVTEHNNFSVNNKTWTVRYQQLFQKRQQQMGSVKPTVTALFHCHEMLMQEAVMLAIEKNESEWGSPPAHFAFFVMGSAARGEQLYWSDQDHGLVFFDKSCR